MVKVKYFLSSILVLFLLSFFNCSEKTGIEEDVFKFKQTINKYSETDNLEQAVISELGSDYIIADWDDIVSYCQSHSPEQFISNLNWQIGEENSLLVVWKNQHFYNNSARHFFISRFDHDKPTHYLAHDNIDNHHIDLGSWYGLKMKILCVKK